jgi:hypothetical protein
MFSDGQTSTWHNYFNMGVYVTYDMKQNLSNFTKFFIIMLGSWKFLNKG